MVQVCNYSSLIFAGNVTLLLIVSMSTDYWEYRQFNSTMLNQSLSKTNNIEIVKPSDTSSYMELWYRRKQFVRSKKYIYQVDTLYQPPILAKNYFLHYYWNKNNGNMTTPPDAVTVYLFTQYGNLFRDCDALEGTVRHRLNMTKFRQSRCTYLSGRTVYSREAYSLPVIHLERAACAFALSCMVCMVTGLIFGAYGLLGHQTRILVWASCCSLASGILLTLSIALFHGKCYILRRMELGAGNFTPLKKLINESRIYLFGWSFVVAWMCVFLCFISSFVWLYKAQDPRHSRIPGEHYIKHRTFNKKEYMAYVDESDG